jgi:hypothetical protein
MHLFFQKYKIYIFLNLFLLIIYFTALTMVKYDISEETMFFYPDSKQYLNTSIEFFDFTQLGDSLTRPFFYPLLILITHQIFGVFSLWLMQFLLWILSINLLFSSIKKITTSTLTAFIGAFIISINFSLIVFTLLGLTEIITVFLLAVLIHRLVNGSLKQMNTSSFNLLLLAILVVTRPVFLYPFILYLIFHFYHFVIKNKMKFKLIYLLIAISPVLFQITLMKIKYDKLKVSEISSITLDDYLLAQTIREIEPEIEYMEAVYKARKIADKKQFIWENKSLVFHFFIQNIRESLDGFPSMFFIKEFKHKNIGKNMALMNKFYFWLHIIFLLPVIFIGVYLLKNSFEKGIILLFLSFLFYYIIITCGISFFQGDRFLIAMLPVWIFIYSLVTLEIIRYFKRGN